MSSNGVARRFSVDKFDACAYEGSGGTMRRILIGNDELLLYGRKRHNTRLTNAVIARAAFVWARAHANAEKVADDQPSRWGLGSHAGEWRLPKTSAQFEIDSDALPALLAFVDEFMREGAAQEQTAAC